MPLEEAQALRRQRALLRSNSAQETRTHPVFFNPRVGGGGFQRGGDWTYIYIYIFIFFFGGGGRFGFFFGNQKLEKDES